MERQKGKLCKSLSAFAIAMLTIIILISSISPYGIFKSINSIENGYDGTQAATKIGTITGWKDRVFGYPSKLGRRYSWRR